MRAVLRRLRVRHVAAVGGVRGFFSSFFCSFLGRKEPKELYLAAGGAEGKTETTSLPDWFSFAPRFPLERKARTGGAEEDGKVFPSFCSFLERKEPKELYLAEGEAERENGKNLAPGLAFFCLLFPLIKRSRIKRIREGKPKKPLPQIDFLLLTFLSRKKSKRRCNL